MGSQTFLSQGTFLFNKKISFDFLDDPKKIKCLNYMYIFVRKLTTWIDRTLLGGGGVVYKRHALLNMLFTKLILT